MGGSFNPAHDGHRHISLLALKRLALDEVWWLASPQNPLKATDGMAPLAERLAAARAVARHPRIRVTDIERRLGTRYTADTLAALRRRFARIRFVWVTGTDNMIQMPKWVNWPAIFETVPVAVFARPSYSLEAMVSKAARRYESRRIDPHRATSLPTLTPPAWIFFPSRLHAGSATAIRAARASKKQADGSAGDTGGQEPYTAPT